MKNVSRMLCVGTLGPLLVLLFGWVMKPLGRTALKEETGWRDQALRVYSFALVPIYNSLSAAFHA